jgi:hypothetical protein
MTHDFGKLTGIKTPSKAVRGCYDVSFTVENDPTDRGVCSSMTLTPDAADRMIKAIEAGVAVTMTDIKADVHGHTYIGFRWNTMSKWAYSDLKKWGF